MQYAWIFLYILEFLLRSLVVDILLCQFSSGKAKFFAFNFAPNSPLDEKIYSLLLYLSEYKIWNYSISAREVLRPIKIFGCTQTTILVIVLNNLSQELSQILANRCLKNCFPVLCKGSDGCSIFKNTGQATYLFHPPIILFSFVSKQFDSIINKMLLDHHS